MTRQQLLPILALAAVTSIAGCDGLNTGQSGNPVGVGRLVTRTKGTGYTTNPQVTFYRVTSATFVTTAGLRDTCYLALYTETGSAGTTSATTVSAGAAISLALGTRTDSLARTVGATDATYHSALLAGIPFTPGDSMVFTIPGDKNGFPTSVFRGKTAERFALNAVTVPAVGNPVPLSWAPAATDSNAAMFVTFRYATGTSTTFNRQIACTFIDDGAGSAPATVTTDWINATKRDVIAQRARTILTQVPVPLSYFNIISVFDWPTPISP